MEGVETSHGPVEKPKDLGLRRQFFGKIRARPKVFLDVLVIFQAFDAQKAAAKEKSDEKVADQGWGIADLGGADGQGHGEAAGEEDGGVDGAIEDDGVFAGLRKG